MLRFSLALILLLAFLPALAQPSSLEVRNLAVKTVLSPVGIPISYEGRFQVLALVPAVSWQGPIRCRALIKGPGHQETLEWEFQGQAGLSDESFRFKIPSRVAEANFNLVLTVSADGANASLQTRFWHQVRDVALHIQAPNSVLEGQPCELKMRTDGGSPPYRWKWTSGALSGEASGQELTVSIPNTTFPKLEVQVWLHDSAHSHPAYQRVTVPVEKWVSSTPIPPPLETVVAEIGGAAETVVGRAEVYNAGASGGSPPYDFVWSSTGSGTPSGESCTLTFDSPGTHSVKVFVRDVMRTGMTTASFSVRVHPRLEAFISGPSLVKSGTRVEFRAEARGGKPPYSYNWATSAGAGSSSRVLVGALRGQPGEARQVNLTVQDSMSPPQSVTVTTSVKVSGAEREGRRLRGELNPAAVQFLTQMLKGSGLGLRQIENIRVNTTPLVMTVDPSSGEVSADPPVLFWEESYLKIDSKGRHLHTTRHRFELSSGRVGVGGRMGGPARVTTQKLLDGAGPPPTTKNVTWAALPGPDGNYYMMPNTQGLPSNFLDESYQTNPEAGKRFMLVAPYRLQPLP